ncbi:MAG: DUF1446 domain-containing protein [Alphaproteobacteria bacterium]|nr:DUF1446 domain-containing protein [Alphaproteobacteria bacterium]
MTKTIRIGGACGFLGDSSTAAPQLIAAGIDYLMLDYLAEVTMSYLAMAKKASPDGGYARDFTDWIWKDNLKEIVRKGVKVVTNAGGTNPHACRARMEQIAREQGVSVKIAIIEGDDIAARAAEFAKGGVKEMFSGAGFPPAEKIAGINAYLGGFAIAEAFAKGADHVITGRVVDSALGLAPLIHEFGWTPADYDKLASGTLIGHILECGAQATGGLHTDWRDVKDWAHIGYPIAECRADGTFVVTKPKGSGGLVTPATVAEQMLYEIGDPQAYIVPDVVCDFAGATFRQAGEDRVEVAGVKGYAPTATYKVCGTYADGWRATSLTPILGIDAPAKAQRQADAVLTRTSEMLRDRNMAPWRASRVDVIGSGATYGVDPNTSSSREVIVKLSVEHDDESAMKIFQREWMSPITSMSVGTTSWHGLNASVLPIVRLFSFLVPKAEVPAIIDIGGERTEHVAAQPAVFDPAEVKRPGGPDAPAANDDLVEVPLIRVAWARSGDKGDAFNVGIFPRKPELAPYLRAALTPEFVAEAFGHEFEKGKAPKVERFDLPGIHGMNFLAHAALGGGGAATMRVDMLAKGKAQQLLDKKIKVPARLVA